MLRKLLLSAVVLILTVTVLGCVGGQAEIDPEAYMVGDKIDVTDNTQFSVMVLLETTGSDYAKPDRGYIFNTVKFELVNNSDAPIELNESDFKIVYGEDVYYPISGKLNFVLDKMPETLTIESGKKYVSKLVWMVPNKPALKLLVFEPAYASEEIKINLNEEK